MSLFVHIPSVIYSDANTTTDDYSTLKIFNILQQTFKELSFQVGVGFDSTVWSSSLFNSHSVAQDVHLHGGMDNIKKRKLKKILLCSLNIVSIGITSLFYEISWLDLAKYHKTKICLFFYYWNALFLFLHIALLY